MEAEIPISSFLGKKVGNILHRSKLPIFVSATVFRICDHSKEAFSFFSLFSGCGLFCAAPLLRAKHFNPHCH
jgi:hypothetical protein